MLRATITTKVGASSALYNNAAMCPATLCAQVPAGNARGCRSSGQVLLRTAAASRPQMAKATRLAETSKSAPPAAFKASRVATNLSSVAAAGDGFAMTSHDLGPTQSAAQSAATSVELGRGGKATPSALSAATRNGGWVRSPCTFHAVVMTSSCKV